MTINCIWERNVLKRIIAALSALMLTASLAACGKKNEESSSGTNDKSSTAASAAENSTDEGNSTAEEDTGSVNPLDNPPVSDAKISLDFGENWAALDDYKKAVKEGSEDKLDYDAINSSEINLTMYLLDGDSSDGTAVVTVTEPVYGETYSKDSVPGLVEAINNMMSQGVDSGADYKFVSCEAAEISGLGAVYVVQKDNVFGEIVKMDQYQFFDEGDVFTVTLYAPADRYDELKSEFDSIINSIKVDH